MDDLDARVRSLQAERQRLEVPARTVTDLLDELIHLIATACGAQKKGTP